VLPTLPTVLLLVPRTQSEGASGMRPGKVTNVPSPTLHSQAARRLPMERPTVAKKDAFKSWERVD
jgi:hypothetical protein